MSNKFTLEQIRAAVRSGKIFTAPREILAEMAYDLNELDRRTLEAIEEAINIDPINPAHWLDDFDEEIKELSLAVLAAQDIPVELRGEAARLVG